MFLFSFFQSDATNSAFSVISLSTTWIRKVNDLLNIIIFWLNESILRSLLCCSLRPEFVAHYAQLKKKLCPGGMEWLICVSFTFELISFSSDTYSRFILQDPEFESYQQDIQEAFIYLTQYLFPRVIDVMYWTVKEGKEENEKLGYGLWECLHVPMILHQVCSFLTIAIHWEEMKRRRFHWMIEWRLFGIYLGWRQFAVYWPHLYTNTIGNTPRSSGDVECWISGLVSYWLIVFFLSLIFLLLPCSKISQSGNRHWRCCMWKPSRAPLKTICLKNFAKKWRKSSFLLKRHIAKWCFWQYFKGVILADWFTI